MAGRDVIGIAKTGSGKTLGFLLPAFARCLTERISGSPIMLVMAPTRELAVQIDADAKRFAGSAGVLTALAYGGAPKGPQLADLRRRPQLLTGTPGRLNDFIEGRMINLGDVKFLVLDEADRMLDMGFEPQIRKVIANVPTRRQTMMFTATWPKEVRRMAQDFFQDPVEIRIGNADELQANADIEQKVIICSTMRDKETQLCNTLRNADGQVIIFTKTKKMCDQLSRSLDRMGVKCEAIHGDRDQRERDIALNSFKSGQARILVATDVAARGLDVKSITVVVNFDPAGNAEDYVHRIGRTGRAGRKGLAVTLLTPDESRPASQIAEVMRKTGKPIPPDLARLAGNAPPPRERRRSRSRKRSRSRRRSRSRSRRRSRSRSRGRPGGGCMGSVSMAGIGGMSGSLGRAVPNLGGANMGGANMGGANMGSATMGSANMGRGMGGMMGGIPGGGMPGMGGMAGVAAGMAAMGRGMQGMPGMGMQGMAGMPGMSGMPGMGGMHGMHGMRGMPGR